MLHAPFRCVITMCEQDLRDIQIQQIVFHKLLFLVTTSSSQTLVIVLRYCTLCRKKNEAHWQRQSFHVYCKSVVAVQWDHLIRNEAVEAGENCQPVFELPTSPTFTITPDPVCASLPDCQHQSEQPASRQQYHQTSRQTSSPCAALPSGDGQSGHKTRERRMWCRG